MDGIPFSSFDEYSDYQVIARGLVTDIINERFKTAGAETPEFSVYVVWFSKTLQNWKALISTTLPDGAYYEVTYDGDKDLAYVDSYKKFDNRAVPIPARKG